MVKEKNRSSASTINLVSRVADALSSTQAPAITDYELGRLVYLKGKPFTAHTPKVAYSGVEDALISVRVLAQLEGTKGFTLFGKSSATQAEIACCIDSFAYVSHLSAMEYHGLTDRFPKILFLTRPTASEWRQQADKKMRKDLSEDYEDYHNCGLPRLTLPTFKQIGGTSIHVHERTQFGAFRHVAGSSLRVATIGRVFLDMIREPKSCGGMQHVLDVYKLEAKRYLALIVDEVNRHGQAIDKVRAGYILTEVCNLPSEGIIDEWVSYAQRGGSRKLDPDAEFATQYSKRWMLSINVPSLTSELDPEDA